MQRPVRVCYVIDDLSVAGTEQRLLGLIHALDRRRVIPHICLLRGRGERSRSLEPADCPVLRLGVGSLARPQTLIAGSRFVHYLRRRRIDVVQLHFPDSTYFGAPLAKLAGTPCIIRTRRNTGYGTTPAQQRLGRFISRLVTATIANSQASRDSVVADEGAKPGSVHVIHNGVDFSRFADCRRFPPMNGAARPRTVGILANLRPVKNLPVFVEAAAAVARRHPGVLFRIAGEGPQRDELARRAGEAGLGGRLTLEGQVRDVPAFLSALDVAVLCSQSEGFSNSVLEYMAAGRPVVATAVGGNLDVLRHEENGLLVPPGDAPALAAAISRLLDDPALARRLGETARREVESRYSSRAEAGKHEHLYWTLVEQAAAARV